MDDVFVEKIVKRHKTGKEVLVIVGLFVAAFVLILALLFFLEYVSVLFPILLAAILYGLWHFLTAQNREFEYIVTNGELDIDVIIARRKRKRVFSAKARDFDVLDSCDSPAYQQALRGRQVTLDCSTHPKSDRNWFLVADHKGQRTLLLFTPDDRILKNLKRYNPSKINYQLTGPAR